MRAAAKRKRIATVLVIITIILFSIDGISLAWIGYYHVSFYQVIFTTPYVTIWGILFVVVFTSILTGIAAVTINGGKPPLRKETTEKNSRV